MRIHVGTSGYNYPEWKGSFYPEDIKAKDMFAFYAERFHAVEINYTFYRMPTAKTTSGWLAQAPAGFQYVLKAPRRITHERRLGAEARDAVEAFCGAARVLGEHLGPLLFQLPPTFRRDVGRLTEFLAMVPKGMRVAFEFRHDSWHDDAVYAALAAGNAALCIADFGDRTTPLEVTARHGYFRLRDEGYGDADLNRWADTVAGFADRWDDAYVFFKHEEEGKGAAFARDFSARLEAHGLAG